MHGDPQRRYRSVEALVRDLDHLLRGEPLEARPDSLGYRARKFVGRNWRGLAVTAAVFAIVVGLVGFFTARLATARDDAVAQARRMRRLQGFMVDLLNGGDEEAGPGQDLRVVTLLERGARQARALDQDPDTQAELYLTLGRLFQSVGAFDRADQLLGAALEKQTARAGEGSVATLGPLKALGELRYHQARYGEAEQLLRRALDLGRRALARDDERVLDAASSLGVVLTEVGRYPEAILILEEVVRVQSAAAVDQPDLSTSLTNLASAQHNLGNYAESDALSRRALGLTRRAFGERHPSVVPNLYNLGATQVQWGHPEQAEPYYREALAIVEEFYGRDHLQTAEALTMLSRALASQKKYDEDAAILQRSLAIRERAYGKGHPKIASTLMDLGHVANGQERLDDAEAAYRRAEAIYRQAYGDQHRLTALAHGNVGAVYLDRKDCATARRMFEETLAVYRQVLPADHSLVAEIEIRIGRTLLREERYAEAEPHTLAGYTVLAGDGHETSWVVSGRRDLAAIYEALGQPEKAARFQAR